MSKHLNVNTKVAQFIDEIGEKELAKHLRRSLYMLTKYHIAEDNPTRSEWVGNGIHFLTELAECLDPQLDDDVV